MKFVVKTKNWIQLTVLSIFIVTTVITAVADGTKKENTQTKVLRIRDKKFEVRLEVLTPTVRVEEPVRFAVQGNQKFYLYLFTVSDNGKGYMILPNKLQQYNVYKPGKRYMVPAKELEFYSDRPGIEEVIMVATTKKVDVNRARFKDIGRFFEGSRKTVDAEVKELRVRATKVDSRIVKQRVKIRVIGGSGGGGFAGIDTPVALPFVGCNKNEFQSGEQMHIRVGADRQGYISLYNRAKNGAITFVKEVPVDGRRFQKITAVASPPTGANTLVALWSNKKGAWNKSAVKKGLRLTNNGKKEFATYTYAVRH